MNIFELIILSIGIGMDAFAVSICKGITLNQYKISYSIIIGLYFGGFQTIMPLIGYSIGMQFMWLISSVDHWLAFILLSVIGLNMIKEALSSEPNINNNSLSPATMLPLAIATSIDALAVGVTFACLEINIYFAITLIGVITFIICCIGTKLGNLFGAKYKNKAEFAGGIIILMIGIKILLNDLITHG